MVLKQFQILTASSTNDAYSLITLIGGYYRLMVNQYKLLLHGAKSLNATLHGPITRDKATNLLLRGTVEGETKDGFFLLRKGRDAHDTFILSVCVAEKVRHYVIKFSADTGMYYHESDPSKGFSDLMGLVEHYRLSADGLPVCLKQMLPPNSTGFAALLDRQILTPAIPEFRLLDSSYQLQGLNLDEETYSLLGEFGEVRKGYLDCGDEHVAVVSRALIKPRGKNKIINFKEFMAKFTELKNTYLTMFYGIEETEKALIFVFEYAAEGPLDQYVKNESNKEENGMTIARLISYLMQIAEGMMFLHSKDCVHGRLCAHNVLVFDSDCVKLSDFYLIQLHKNGHSFSHESQRGHSYCWWSPQALLNNEFSKESDIWSFGVTVWELFAMKRPYHSSFTGDIVLSLEEVRIRYMEGRYLNPSRPNCPSSVASLIKRCFAPKPEDRLSFRDLVTELRSPELMSDDEASEILLHPDHMEVEDWEVLPSSENALELLTMQTDSQVSNVDYACLPCTEGGEMSLNDDYSTTAGISLINSLSLFDNASSRKRSLSKTFSFPSLTTENEYESSSSRVQGNLDVMRQRSSTGVSSCPPSLQTSNEGSLERIGQQMEPTETQEDIRYVSDPLAALPQTNQQTVLVFRNNNIEDPTESQSEETTSSDNYSNDDEMAGAEAEAMQSLGKHFFGLDLDEHLCSSVVDTEFGMLSVIPDADVDQGDEEDVEQLSTVGSSTSTSLETAANDGSVTKVVQPTYHTEEQHGKYRAGSYVTLANGTSGSPPPQDKLKGSATMQLASTGHVENEVGFSPVQATFLPSPISNITATSEMTQTTKHQNVMEIDDSPYQSHLTIRQNQQQKFPNELLSQLSSSDGLPEGSECSDDRGSGLITTPCISADAFLASFTRNVQNETGSFADELLSETDDCSLEEGSSPLITDLQEESDINSADFSAERSLGKFYPKHTVGLNKDSILYQSCEDKDLSPPDSQFCAGTEPEDFKSSLCVIANTQEEKENKQEERTRTLTKRGFSGCGPDLVTSANSLASATKSACFLLPEMMETQFKEESGGEDEDSEDEDIEDTLSHPCPFDNPLLVFDQAQEHLELKEFALNNLSKEQDKTSEFLDFKEDHFVGQIDEAGMEDTCSLNDNREAEGGFEESVSENHDYKKESDLKGGIPRHHDGSIEEHLRRPVNPSYKVLAEELPEPLDSFSHSSSSDGIWPSCSNKGPRRSIIGSTSSCAEELPTLDTNKIPSELLIPYEDLVWHEPLGRGQFGEVRKASIVSSNQMGTPKRDEVAVKVLKDKASAKDSNDFIKEVETMILLASKQDCKYIIKLRGVSKDKKDKLMLVTELAPLGALVDYLPRNKDILRTPMLLEFCAQICQGMRYLESQKLLHRDLAARNILVMREDLVKISDFGLSRLEEYYKLQESHKVPIKWYALESLIEKRFTTKSDVWSFGVTMWEIFSFGDKPYKDVENRRLPEFLESGNRLPCPPKCSQKVYEVMRNCWIKDTSKRPSFFLLETTYLEKLQEEYPLDGEV
ncbi:Epidermal growth factor receptor [Stylophora pistillata]|uniref:non-specific protein-tyrosine kinase n=1 Tax=Stylophora pistillata TaxID=50429 RepID=A0A2B4RP77_STYPI|nr:Epidermal growth factor receptor [Stylophora pistillata]